MADGRMCGGLCSVVNGTNGTVVAGNGTFSGTSSLYEAMPLFQMSTVVALVTYLLTGQAF